MLLLVSAAMPSHAQGVTRADSSGIELIDNGARDRERIAFRLPESPRCDINMTAGTRVVVPIDAIRTQDGRVAVADARSNGLAFFDCDGTLIGAAGGKELGRDRAYGDAIERVLPWRMDSLIVGQRSRTIVVDRDGNVADRPASGRVLCTLGDGSALGSVGQVVEKGMKRHLRWSFGSGRVA